MSSICDFYNKQTILLTGATGFLGKLIMEKLLRCCYDVEKIYIIVRSKYDKNQEERMKKLYDKECFAELRNTHPDFQKKIHILNSDCSRPCFGLNESIQTILKKEVSCVIHAAANVKFDADLRTTVNTNTRCTRDLLLLASEMEKLRAFVYVSTAYSHCPIKEIAEEFYDVNISPETLLKLIDILDDETLAILKDHIIGKWPNTYVYSKALAEEMIRNHKPTLPIAIVRPAIITSAAKEPLSGWLDNLQGVGGVALGASLGVLRTIQMSSSLNAEIVPVDYVVNCILTAGWAIDKFKFDKNKNDIPIYNFTGCKDNIITWGETINLFRKYQFDYASTSMIYYPFLFTSRHRLVHKVRSFFLHTLLAYLADLVFLTIGRKTFAVKKLKKVEFLLDVLSFFTTKSWNFSNDKLQELCEKMSEEDRIIFNFDLKTMNWEEYITNCLKGGRIYIVKDPMETLPAAKRKFYILVVTHYCIVVVLYYLTFVIIWYLLKLIF